MKPLASTALIASLTGLLGCGHLVEKDGTFAQHGVGPVGGTVQTSTVTLTIPPGALSREVVFTIAPAPSAPAGAGQAFTISPVGTLFARPVTIAVTLTDVATRTERTRVLALAGDLWLPLAQHTLDLGKRVASAPVRQLASVYGIGLAATCAEEIACGHGLTCADGICEAVTVPCESDLECASGDVCRANACGPQPPACDIDAQCGSNGACIAHSCAPAAGCSADVDCRGLDNVSTWFCDARTHACLPARIGCAQDSDCCAGQICESGRHQCVNAATACSCSDGDASCEDAANCTVVGQHCRPTSAGSASHACVFDHCDAAAGNACAAGLQCFNGFCVGDLPCHGGCTLGQVCVAAANTCMTVAGYASWAGCERTCAAGEMLVFAPRDNIFEQCNPDLRQCACAPVPFQEAQRNQLAAVGDAMRRFQADAQAWPWRKGVWHPQPASGDAEVTARGFNADDSALFVQPDGLERCSGSVPAPCWSGPYLPDATSMADATMLDAWGRPLMYAFIRPFDGSGGGLASLPWGSIVIWSRGPDGVDQTGCSDGACTLNLLSLATARSTVNGADDVILRIGDALTDHLLPAKTDLVVVDASQPRATAFVALRQPVELAVKGTQDVNGTSNAVSGVTVSYQVTTGAGPDAVLSTSMTSTNLTGSASVLFTGFSLGTYVVSASASTISVPVSWTIAVTSNVYCESRSACESSQSCEFGSCTSEPVRSGAVNISAEVTSLGAIAAAMRLFHNDTGLWPWGDTGWHSLPYVDAQSHSQLDPQLDPFPFAVVDTALFSQPADMTQCDAVAPVRPCWNGPYLTGATSLADGAMLDHWGHPRLYSYIRPNDGGGGGVSNAKDGGIVIWSRGPNGADETGCYEASCGRDMTKLVKGLPSSTSSDDVVMLVSLAR